MKEHCFLILSNEYVVADPMGGDAGATVARMALETLGTALEEGAAPVDAIRRANAQAWEAIERSPQLRGAGCTLVVMRAHGTDIEIGYVGDAMAYRFRAGALNALVEPHTMRNDLVHRNRLEPNDPTLAGLPENIIVRAIGMSAEVEPDEARDIAEADDTYLLCSNGVAATLGEDHLTRILAKYQHAELREAVDALISAARAMGGPDQLTAVLVRFRPGSLDC